MDGNLHGGPQLIKNDPNRQNKNGQLFMQFLERNPSLFVANNLDICEGTITRQRILENKTEKAVLDFFCMNDKMRSFLSRVKIDEDREFVLSNFSQFKKNKRVIETDHNTMIADFDVTVPKRKPQRIELFNLRNSKCQESFTKETDDNTQLVKCFENQMPFERQCKMWLNTFNSILHNCFRKVRVVNNKKKQTQNEKNLVERIELKKKVKLPNIDEDMKRKIEERILQIEEEVGNDISEKYYEEVLVTLKKLGGDRTNLSGSGRKKMWELLKRKYPKNSPSVPVGKKDNFGNLITNHEGLKKLYLQTYTQRLRNRPIKKELKELKVLKEELFHMRIELAKCRKSVPWTMDDLEMILKHLKTGKSRDPNGWCNELFSNDVAGKQLKLSILLMFNKMKSDNYIPDFIRNADVATFYKGKGGKCELVNDRGIFLVTVFRSILMRLIYVEKYSQIDSNMSDSQIGGRKGKNVRNHIWVLNGIINEVLSSKTKIPVDISIFDYKQCFDSLWLEECMNDMYSGGLKDDKFALLYNVNSSVKVAVKTPVGKTTRGSIRNAIIQGDVFGPLLCSKQVDTFGSECIEQNKYLYSYKGKVDIPPLGRVDDLI